MYCILLKFPFPCDQQEILLESQDKKKKSLCDAVLLLSSLQGFDRGGSE